MKWGCSTLAFRWHSLDTALDCMANLGFKFVDIGAIRCLCEHLDPATLTSSDVERLKNKLKSLELNVVSLNSMYGAFNDPSEEVRSRQITRIKSSMDLIKALGGDIVTTTVGEKLEWQPIEESLKLIKSGVEECIAYGKNLEVRLALEMPHKQTPADNLDETMKMIDILGDEEILLTLDTSQVIYGGDSVVNAVQTLGRRIAHVHLRDARDKYTRVAPGKGEVGFAGFFSAMNNINYRGVYTIEFEVDEYSTTDLKKIAEGISEAKEFLKGVVC